MKSPNPEQLNEKVDHKPDGKEDAHVLRAKIDVASPNINMRDPIIYRIRKAHHHRTGDKLCPQGCNQIRYDIREQRVQGRGKTARASKATGMRPTSE